LLLSSTASLKVAFADQSTAHAEDGSKQQQSGTAKIALFTVYRF